MSRVEASNKVRLFDMSNTQCANVNGNQANCNVVTKRALITLTFDSTIPSGSRINATFNYTYSQRTLWATASIWQNLDIYKVYQVDSQGNVVDITSNCNLGKSASASRTGTGLTDTELRQYFVQGTCNYIATVDTISILLEPTNIYQNNGTPGQGSATVLISNFTATSNPDGTEEIINNATNNTINIINNAQNNTTQIMENANANAEAIANAISKQYDYCNQYNLDNNILTGDGYLDGYGGIIANTPNWFHTSDYLLINYGKTYTINKRYTGGAGANYCIYDENKNIINCTNYPTTSGEFNITINQANAKYIRYSGKIEGGTQTYFTGEYCTTYLESMSGDAAAQPDMSTIENEHAQQIQIFNELSDFDWTTIQDVQIDENANETIWTLVERVLFTNLYIGGTALTLLGLGIIKLILLR